LDSFTVFFRDTAHGLLEVSHNSLALLGLGLVAALLFLGGRPELRHTAEAEALSWLQARQEARTEPQPQPQPTLEQQLSEPDAIGRATAADPRELDRQQAAVARWLSPAIAWPPNP